MKQGSSQRVKKQQSPTKEVEVLWPFFGPANVPLLQKFWEKKNIKTICPTKEELYYETIMLRIGKKKKTQKGYFYKISREGVLSYYKKEADKIAKGYLQLGLEVSAHLIEQKNRKESMLVILIERCQGLNITLFGSKPQLALELFDKLKDFCVVTGFDKLYTQLEVLGKGSFASVYKIKSQTSDSTYAAKTYFKETFEQSQHKNKFV